MKTEKELGAIRVLEALSAVDEELLERSGKASAESKNRRTVRGFVQKYAMACAACLCLLVMGAAYFGMSRMGAGGFSQSSDGMNGGSKGGDFGSMAAGGDNAAREEIADGAAQTAGDSFAWDEEAVPMEPEWLDVELLGALPGEAATGEQAAEETAKENELTASAGEPAESDGAAVQDAREKVSFAAAVEVPEGYSLLDTGAANENQGSQVYEWSDGEHSLWLRVTSTELTTDARIDVEPPLYTVQEEWKELIPDAGADGYVRFALLYDNGMLVEYCGALEREDIIGLLDSLSW